MVAYRHYIPLLALHIPFRVPVIVGISRHFVWLVVVRSIDIRLVATGLVFVRRQPNCRPPNCIPFNIYMTTGAETGRMGETKLSKHGHAR